MELINKERLADRIKAKLEPSNASDELEPSAEEEKSPGEALCEAIDAHDYPGIEAAVKRMK